MLRWLKAWPAAALWAFVLAAGVALIEGLYMWLRFDVIGDGDGGGIVAKLLPAMALYGWWGGVSAALLFPLCGLLAQATDRPRKLAFSLAVAGAMAALVLVYCSYALREHLLVDWWADHGTGSGRIVLALIWAISFFVLRHPVARVADFLVRSPGKGMVFPFALLVVASATWPDWREEGAAVRTGTLGERVEAAADAPNLILVTIDTWRADQLSCHDPESPPTPALDAFAAAAVDYRNVWTPTCWTLPSMAAFMTGQPPRALALDKKSPLPRSAPTLAEIAWRNGYHTAGISSNPYLSSDYGFDRGFIEFDHSLVRDPLQPAGRSLLVRELTNFVEQNLEPEDASVLLGKASRWIDLRQDERPFFLWVHLMNPHLPYVWRDLPDPAVAGGPGRVPDLAAVPQSDPLFDGARLERRVDVEARIAAGIDPATIAAMRTLYSREVQYTDAWMGRFLASVTAGGFAENSLVVVTADHGEEFFEHGGYEHGHSLMPEVSCVPLLVRLPAGRCGGTVRNEPVSTLDLLPTICAEMGWSAPADIPGLADLWPAPGREFPPVAADRVLRLENMLYGAPKVGLLKWPWYFVGGLNGGRSGWYDLSAAADASKLAQPPRDLALAVIAEGRRLAQQWDAHAVALADTTNAVEQPISADVQRKLRSLGY